jgi:hypothetical protein
MYFVDLSFSTFVTALSELSQHFRQDTPVYSAFNKCCNGLIELAKFHSTLLDQIQRAVGRNLGDFLKKYETASSSVRKSSHVAKSKKSLTLNTKFPTFSKYFSNTFELSSCYFIGILNAADAANATSKQTNADSPT